MAKFQIAIGHDNVAGLVNISPQPQQFGFTYGTEEYANSGALLKRGSLNSSLVYNRVLQYGAYDTLLTAFGLASANYANVTIRMKSEEAISGGYDRDFENYNAIIYRPTPRRMAGNLGWENVEFPLRFIVHIPD